MLNIIFVVIIVLCGGVIVVMFVCLIRGGRTAPPALVRVLLIVVIDGAAYCVLGVHRVLRVAVGLSRRGVRLRGEEVPGNGKGVN